MQRETMKKIISLAAFSLSCVAPVYPSSGGNTTVIVYQCNCTNCTCIQSKMNAVGDKKIIDARSINFTSYKKITTETSISITLPTLNRMNGFSFTPTTGEAAQRKKTIRILLYHLSAGKIKFYRQFTDESQLIWTEVGEISSTEQELQAMPPISIQLKDDGSAIIPNPKSPSQPTMLFLGKLFV